MKNSALKISMTAITSCLICICAWISIPIAGVPMTLQTLGIAFCGYLLGARIGTVATALYLTLGAVGLPVFAGFGGSLAFLVGPTGGFLIGFLPLACLIGIASKRKNILAELAFAFLGLFVCHLLGILWFAHVSGISIAQAFLLSSLPYIVKDILSIILARFLFLEIRKRAANLSFFKNSK